MKRFYSFLLILLVSVAAFAQQPPPAAQQDGITLYFSPKGGCTEAIIDQIGQAKKSIRILAYSFTSAPIAESLLRAKDRGVSISVVLDASQATSKYSSATFFFNQSIPVFTDPNHAAAHNKVILIDDHTILTGSFNFSKNAEENNSENLLILRDKPDLFAAFAKNFQEHLSHAIKYDGIQETIKDINAASDASVAGGRSAVANAPPTQEVAAETVYVTKSGKKYHRSGCRHLSKSSIPIAISDAKSKGHSPCSVCRP